MFILTEDLFISHQSNLLSAMVENTFEHYQAPLSRPNTFNIAYDSNDKRSIKKIRIQMVIKITTKT